MWFGVVVSFASQILSWPCLTIFTHSSEISALSLQVNSGLNFSLEECKLVD